MARIAIVSYGVKPADQFLANPMNPRTHPMNQRAALGDSLSRVGFIAPVIENQRTGYLLDGHERVWQALRENNADVPYVIVDVAPEDEAYVLATFDPISSLAQIDVEAMAALLGTFEVTEPAIQTMLDDIMAGACEPGKSADYSRKIEAPTYEPKNECPKVSEVYDRTRTDELLAEIDAAEGLTEDERVFLRVAAQRHTVLRFDRIADYYAQAGDTVKRLMEHSALVIIDYDKAIEQGFIAMTEALTEQVRKEYGV